MAVQLDVRQGVVLRAGEGEPLFGGRILIKASFDELCVTETVYDRARDGASPHYHRHHADSFYVIEGGFAVLGMDEIVDELVVPLARVRHGATMPHPGPGGRRLPPSGFTLSPKDARVARGT